MSVTDSRSCVSRAIRRRRIGSAMTRDEAVHVLETLKWMSELLAAVEEQGVKFSVPVDLCYDTAVTTAILEKYCNEDEEGERITWN